MVGRLQIPDAIFSYCKRKPAKGIIKHGKPSITVRFTPGLFSQIRAEAIVRGISVSAMVNLLCNASIDGIE